MKKTILGVLGLTTLLISGCTSTKTTDINVLATTDLHGVIPNELSSYVENEKKKDKNITLVDAGDFFDGGFEASGDMNKYFEKRRENAENKNEKYIEVPIAKEMKDVGYDTVTLGNHEFVSNNKFHLDNMISDFEKQGISVLSANTYKKNGDNYTKPYVIKDIKTNEGTVKLGILGLTIKEVGENSEDLKDFDKADGYSDLYMNDLVEDAKKWVKVMKEDKADVIVVVTHTGEKPKKPKHPGNRIQDLAQQVDGIDAIVAGHTHEQIKQHDYKNKSGENVIVTQPGDHGDCISKINLKLEKKDNKWNVVDKSSEIKQFEESKKYLNQLCDNYGKVSAEFTMLNPKVKEINLSNIVPIKWDKAYVFKPNTTREKIYDAVGYKFLNITEAENDDMMQMVFMNNKKVVCYLYGHKGKIGYSVNFDKSEYKDNVLTIIPKENDKFKVEEGKEHPITHQPIVKLTHIYK